MSCQTVPLCLQEQLPALMAQPRSWQSLCGDEQLLCMTTNGTNTRSSSWSLNAEWKSVTQACYQLRNNCETVETIKKTLNIQNGDGLDFHQKHIHILPTEGALVNFSPFGSTSIMDCRELVCNFLPLPWLILVSPVLLHHRGMYLCFLPCAAVPAH